MRSSVNAIIAVLILSGSAFASASDLGEEVFESACSTCHAENMSAEETDHANNLAAPPMNLLTTIIRKKTGNDKDAFVRHVVDFTKNPSVDKVKAMPRAVKRFGLMPPVAKIDPDLSGREIQAVAEWLFERFDYSKQLQDLKKHQAKDAH